MVIAYPGCHLRDPFIEARCRLDLTRFDAEAPKLHLGIDASEEFQFFIFVIPYQIAGTVHFHLHPIDKRTRYEFFFRKLLLLPVPLCDLRSGKAQFSRHSLRHQVSVLIADKGPGVGHGPANRNIRIPILIHRVE